MSASARTPGGDDATQAMIRALYTTAVGQIQAAQQGSGADRWGSAIESFDRVVDLAPASPLGYLGRGWARALAGDDELALEDLGRAIQVGTELPQVYATRARFFETHGQLAKALEDYDEAVARSSRDAELLRDRAAVRLAQRDWKGALEDLNAAADIRPELAEVRRMRAGILESQQRHEEAIADLDFLIAHGSAGAAVYRDRGNSRGALGDHRGAIADFTAALERDPSLADAYLARAYAHANLGEDEEAVADYTRALQLDETLVKAYRRRGEAFLRLGKPQLALPDLDRFLDLGADSPEAFTLRARAREGVGKIDGALADYTHALESDPTSLPAYLGRGRVQLTRGHPELSLSDYDAAVAIDPSCTDAYIGRAAAYQALGDAEQAAWDHQRAAALDPDRVEAHRGLVLADLATGEEYQDRRLVGKADETYRSALEHADTGLTVAAGDRVLRTCRAAALRALGACDRALDEVRALLDEGPVDDAEAGRLRTEAGHTLLQWGRLTRRPELIDEALSQLEGPAEGPDGAAALELAGTALAELGRHEEAVQRFAMAAERAPTAPGVLLGMGSAYLRLGQSSEALAAFARLLQDCVQRDRIERWARVGRALALGRLGGSGIETGLTRALKRAKDDAVSHVERGSRLEFFGALDEAERDFRTAVELAPSWGTAHHVLALLLIARAADTESAPDVRTARLEEATRLAGYAIERHKIGAAEPYYRQTAGRAYLLLGRTREALEHLRRAVEVNPDHVGMRADLDAAESAARD